MSIQQIHVPPSEVNLSSFQNLHEFLEEFSSKMTAVDNLVAYSSGELDFQFEDVDGRWYQIHMFHFEKSLSRMIVSDESVIYTTRDKRYFFQILEGIDTYSGKRKV